MISELLHSSQWCYRHKLNRLGAFMEKIMILTCSAHISGKAKIHPTVSFSHGGIGVVINPAAEVGEYCIINNKVTLGNGFPHGYWRVRRNKAKENNRLEFAILNVCKFCTFGDDVLLGY